MTAFRVIYNYFKSHKSWTISDIAERCKASDRTINNWMKNGFTFTPKFSAENLTFALFDDPQFADNWLMKDFLNFLADRKYPIPSKAKEFINTDISADEFVNILASFLDGDSPNKIPDTLTVYDENIYSTPYESVFSTIDCISNVSLPDYSTLTNMTTKNCDVSRAALISIVKHCLNVDIDNELSEGYSADELNQRIQNSNNDFLKEYAALGYGFEMKNGLIIVRRPQSENYVETDNDTLFDTLKTLHEAYELYDIHSDVSGQKKIELNRCISVFSNALAFSGVFNTIERKRYYCNLVTTMIKTHNHDCNYLYPILVIIKGKEKRPPLVEVGIDQVAEFVGDYCYDVYCTDNNTLDFIGNFLQTLDFYDVGEAKKVAILKKIIYEKKTYDLRIWEVLVRTDKSQITALQTYLEINVFSLFGKAITDTSRRELIAFICMFGRGTFDGLIYFDAPEAVGFLTSFAKTLNFVLAKFGVLVPAGHIRKKDVSYGLSRALLTMTKYNAELAKQTLGNIDISELHFAECILLKEVYYFLVNNEASVACAKEFRNIFSTTEEYFKYIEDKLLCFENPFLTEGKPMLLDAVKNIQSAANGKVCYIVSDKLKEFADNILLWLLEATEANVAQNVPLRYLEWLFQYPRCIDNNKTKIYQERRKELFKSLLSHAHIDKVDIRLLNKLWQPFKYDLKQNSMRLELNDCIKYCINGNKRGLNISFLVSNFEYANTENREAIVNLIKIAIDKNEFLSMNVVNAIKIADILRKEENTEYILKMLLCIPRFTSLTIHERFRLFGKLVTREIAEDISKELTNGNIDYFECIYFLINSKLRSWERAYLKGILSRLLRPEIFMSLNVELQISLIHYVKDKGEYYGNLRFLTRYISEQNLFEKLVSRLKTALTIQCRPYINLHAPENSCYMEFLQSILDSLTQNAYMHADIKKSYGLRTDTLVYHILEIYKDRPDKTATICISSICKIYKQLLNCSEDNEFDVHTTRLLTDRIKLFSVVIANPCIRNTSKHYVAKMYQLLNSRCGKIDSQLEKLNKILVDILRDGVWPTWFDVGQVDAVQSDEIQTNVAIQKSLFWVDTDCYIVHTSNDKVQNDLKNWRGKMDFDSALIPSDENEVVAIKKENCYFPISGWKLVYECLSKDNTPLLIEATVVSVFGMNKPLQFVNNSYEKMTCEMIVYSFKKLFDTLMNNIPSKIKKEKYYRVYIKEDAYDVINKEILPELVAFVNFYYDYIHGTIGGKPKIKTYALEAYYDYYKDVKNKLSCFL